MQLTKSEVNILVKDIYISRNVATSITNSTRYADSTCRTHFPHINSTLASSGGIRFLVA